MNKLLFQLIKIRLLGSVGGAFKTNRSETNQKKRLLKFILLFFLLAYCVIVFCGMFALLFYTICEPYCSMDIEWFYFAVVFVVAFAICFFGSVFATQSQIYDSRDNELLLSMPIPTEFILSGRVLSVIVTNFIYESVVILPAIIVFLIFGNMTVMRAIGIVFLIVAVPILSTAISSVVGGALAIVSAKMKRKKNIFTILFSIVFLVLYFVFFNNASEYMQLLVANGMSLATSVKNGFYPLYAIGASADGNILLLLFSLIAIIVVFGLVYFILSKSFFKIFAMQSTGDKIKYRKKELKQTAPLWALVKKEFSRFISSAMYVMNSGMGVIFSVILAVVIVLKGELVQHTFEAIPQIEKLLEATLIFAGLELASTTTISSVSISIEGKKIYLSQLFPINATDILLAKGINHFIVGEIGVLIVGVAAAMVMPGSIISKLFYIIVPTVMTAFCAIFGVLINLIFPKLEWVSEAVAIKQGMSPLIAMLGTSAVSVVYLIGSVVCMNFMPTELFTTIYLLLLLLAIYFIYQYIKNKGAEAFLKLGQK